MLSNKGRLYGLPFFNDDYIICVKLFMNYKYNLKL